MPTYTKESHASTTHYTTYSGWGIMCDNQDIMCDSQEYYCDGAVVMRRAAGVNLCLQSQAFDNASWTKTRATITTDATTAPDGTSTADKIVEDATAANDHQMYQVIAKETFKDDVNVTFSIFRLYKLLKHNG